MDYSAPHSQFTLDLCHANSPTDMITTLESYLRDTLNPQRLFIFTKQNNKYVSHGHTTDLEFDINGTLVKALSNANQGLQIRPNNTVADADYARLAVMDVDWCLPLHKDQLLGWVAIKVGADTPSPAMQKFVTDLTQQTATIMAQTQRVLELEQRVTELNVLNQISQAINFSIRFEDLLELIYAQSSRILDTQNFQILFRETADANIKTMFAVKNDERRLDVEGQIHPHGGGGLAGEVIRSGLAIRTNQYLSTCNQLETTPYDDQTLNLLGVPLNIGSRTLGAMVVFNDNPKASYSEAQLQNFSAIATQAATALEKARLYEETENNARQLRLLNDVGHALSESLELDQLANTIVKTAAKLLDVEHSVLYLANTLDNCYDCQGATDLLQALCGKQYQINIAPFDKLASADRPLIWSGDEAQQILPESAAIDTPIGSLMMTTMRLGERTVGMLAVADVRDTRRFTAEDETLLMAFTSQAAMSLENARLFTQTDQKLAARLEELSLLQAIDRQLNTGLDLQRILQIALDQSVGASGATAGALALVDGIALQQLEFSGYPESSTIHQIKPENFTSHPLVARTISMREAQQASAHGAITGKTGYLSNSRAQTCLPILRDEQVRGVLLLESMQPDTFSAERIAFLNQLMDHTGVAIENAHLYQGIQEANLAKSEFISFISHELRTPMTSIKGYTDMLSQGMVGALTDPQLNFLGTIRNNIERMATLVSDLADIARIETGRLRLDQAIFDFKMIVDDVTRSIQGQVDEKQQTLHVDIEPNMPHIWGDHVRHTQVLTNMVSNAHKYTPQGGEIYLSVKKAENKWDPNGASEVLLIAVKDNGIGISEEDQRKLFEKFFRSEDRDVRSVVGTGLGLNIVKSLVELQGGRTWFESALGEGSTFYFTIPVGDKVI